MRFKTEDRKKIYERLTELMIEHGAVRACDVRDIFSEERLCNVRWWDSDTIRTYLRLMKAKGLVDTRALEMYKYPRQVEYFLKK